MFSNRIKLGDTYSNQLGCQVYIESANEFIFQETKSELIDIEGKTGAFCRSNQNKSYVERTIAINLIAPTNENLRTVKRWLQQENVFAVFPWEEDVKYLVYKIRTIHAFRNAVGNYVLEVTFVYNPTAFLIEPEVITLNRKGKKAIKTKGTAIAYPKIEFTTNTTEQLRLTFKDQHIIFPNGLKGEFCMDSNPRNPYVSVNGIINKIAWKGDFIEFNAAKDNYIGLSLSEDIGDVVVTVNWGYA